MIRVYLPPHLRELTHARGEVELQALESPTLGALLDALEAQYPVLRGTIRNQFTLKRRPFIRFYACEQDLSFAAPDDPLPDKVMRGEERFMVIGAMAGG